MVRNAVARLWHYITAVCKKTEKMLVLMLLLRTSTEDVITACSTKTLSNLIYGKNFLNHLDTLYSPAETDIIKSFHQFSAGIHTSM